MTKITIDISTVKKALEAMLYFPDDISDEMLKSIIALRTALAQPQEPDPWGAGYEAGYAAGVAEHPAQPVQDHFPDATKTVQAPVQDPENGGKTGWPPGLLQDDCRGLSKWLASRPDARQRLREALAEQEQDTDCHAQGICQRSGYCIVQRKPLTETSAERTLKRMGYTDCGAELWKPPLGDPAQPSLPTNAEIAWKMGYEAGKCEANGVLDAILPPSLVKPVGIVSHLVKGDVVWQRWPADMPDGTRLWGEVQP